MSLFTWRLKIASYYQATIFISLGNLHKRFKGLEYERGYNKARCEHNRDDKKTILSCLWHTEAYTVPSWGEVEGKLGKWKSEINTGQRIELPSMVLLFLSGFVCTFVL